MRLNKLAGEPGLDGLIGTISDSDAISVPPSLPKLFTNVSLMTGCSAVQTLRSGLFSGVRKKSKFVPLTKLERVNIDTVR